MSSGMLNAGALRAERVARAGLWQWSSLGRERGEIEEAAFPILSGWALPRPGDWLDNSQSATERSGTGDSPPVRQPRLSLRRCRLDCPDSEKPEPGIDSSLLRATENEVVIAQAAAFCPILGAVTFSPASRNAMAST